MRKTIPDMNQSLLSLTCEVLQKIQETYPRHDQLIQGLEPRLDKAVADWQARQSEEHRQMNGILKRGLQRVEDKIKPLLQERKALLRALCKIHSDQAALLEAMAEKTVDREIVAQTRMMVSWVERFLESNGIEIITHTVGLPYDAALMHIQRREKRADVPGGTVIQELSPGYRLIRGDGSRCLSRARVVINSEPA